MPVRSPTRLVRLLPLGALPGRLLQLDLAGLHVLLRVLVSRGIDEAARAGGDGGSCQQELEISIGRP